MKIIKEKLEIVYLKTEQLILLENNPRKLIHSGNLEKLKNLISEHGFQNPLQVYKEKTGIYSILCGNHRYLAAKELGYTEFPCIVYNGSRSKAIARAIADNRSGEWTEWNKAKLADALLGIDTGDFDLTNLTGFEPEELDDLLEITEEGMLVSVIPKMEIQPDERWDYIVLMFKDVQDWIHALSVFDIKKVDYSVVEKKKIGLGRVIDGVKAMNKLLKQ